MEKNLLDNQKKGETKKKSPLRYPGGKSRAIKFTTQLIPEFKECRH